MLFNSFGVIKFKFQRFNLLILLLLIGNTLAYAENVRIAQAAGEEHKLHYRLLREALRRGGIYSPEYPFGTPESLPLSTRIQGMRNNELDIFSAMTNKEYEEEFLPIYIPLFRGMMGMRLAIVKQSNANLFSDVKNLEDLKQFTAGQGKLWSDSEILEANNIPLVRELKYSNLFRMLDAERFDYFPRGIHEPWQEVESHQDLNLVVDKHIMLWYTAPFYLFVNKNNQELAKHISEQLLFMIEDGTFQAFFEADEDVKKALTLAGLGNRTIIRIKNPLLPHRTPIDNKALWFDPIHYESPTD